MLHDQRWSLLLLAAIFIASPLSAQEKVIFPVAASTKTTGYTPLWAALKQGFFAQQGLDV
jgi:ABC-type nitrate/sulfonate/bicarbonate transport system substrate-binding protein